ncbi:putative ATPase [Allocatelliglobosispora scoriae]|uniref:Putative ATPase n=1 Tax=Allocatelliglobosispora scoriae TaxID=643052 RepID=A0A841BSQ8_9ACTN|nr:BTAD domain-containing putative transcriptional regulator [Allocatelliglobosispora scoriae]MBB5869772.1 putative ATPase [Allocatelliglobosispora scoriae]
MEISLLGPLQVRLDDGSVVDVGGARLRALLIRLALDAGRVVTQSALVDAVWADDPPANAVNALQALVSRLRRGGVPIEGLSAGYRLAVPADAVDAHRFERLIAAGDLDRALALWRGPALADVAEAEFARAPVARLTELHLGAVEDRLDERITAGRVDVAEIDELVVAQPLRERPVHLLMRALAGQGRHAEALAAFDRYRELVADQLGGDPSPGLAELHLAILRQELAPAPGPVRTNLRATRTSFLGREDDLLKVGELIGGARLTTLIGPGGSGKTRLAIESAGAALDLFPDGVWMVELAPVTEGAELAQAVLGVMGAREQKLRSDPLLNELREPMDRLVATLRHKRVLLVLDNCEHLIAAVAVLADQLLGDCPELRILATSREPLGIDGEMLWPVEPLHLAEAVRLLAERARAVLPGFVVDDANRPQVVAICRALDGMPLAIELAAARLRTMTPAQLAARIDDRFRLLRGGVRTALPRHQTLRAVIDWSWDLLSVDERAVWQRLALFAGGATAEAAEAVCGRDVLDLLTALADKSLCRSEGDRYLMLETIREYGLERLAEAPDDAERLARLAWATYFVELAERAEPMLRSPQQLDWLAVFETEHDNMHAVLRWAIAHEETVIAMRLIANIGWYWWLRGYRGEAAELVRSVLALPGEVDPRLRAQTALYGSVASVDAFGDFDQAKLWLTEASELIRGVTVVHPMLRLITPMRALMTAGVEGMPEALAEFEPFFDDEDRWVASVTRAFHGHAMLNLGLDAAGAVIDFEIALAGFRELGDRWGMGLVLDALATLDAQRGDAAGAARHAREAIALIEPLGTKEDQVQLRLRLAWARWQEGAYDQAAAEIETASRVADRLGMPVATSSVEHAKATLCRLQGDLAASKRHLERAAELVHGVTAAPQYFAMLADGLAMVAGAAGEFGESRRHHERALELAIESGDAPIVGLVLIGYADLAVRCGDPEQAAVMLGASTGVMGMIDLSSMDWARIEAQARAAIGDDRYAAAFERGSACTMKTAEELANGPTVDRPGRDIGR